MNAKWPKTNKSRATSWKSTRKWRTRSPSSVSTSRLMVPPTWVSLSHRPPAKRMSDPWWSTGTTFSSRTVWSSPRWGETDTTTRASLMTTPRSSTRLREARPACPRCASVNKSSLSKPRATKVRIPWLAGISSLWVGRPQRDMKSCPVLRIEGNLETFNSKGSSSRETRRGVSMLCRRKSNKSCSLGWRLEMLLRCTGRVRIRAHVAVVWTRVLSKYRRCLRDPPFPKTTTTQSKREESIQRLPGAALDATKICWPLWPKHRPLLAKPLSALRPLKTRSSAGRAANGVTIPRCSASMRNPKRSNWKSSRQKWPTTARPWAGFKIKKA